MTTHKMPAMPAMPGGRGKGTSHPCVCGCGLPTKREWHPGHDGRATGWAIRVERGVITIADVPDNERRGAIRMMVRRAAAVKAAADAKVQAA